MQTLLVVIACLMGTTGLSHKESLGAAEENRPTPAAIRLQVAVRSALGEPIREGSPERRPMRPLRR